MTPFEEIWEGLTDIPADEDGCIETPFLHFEIGTDCHDIWHWIEDTYDVTLGEILYETF